MRLVDAGVTVKDRIILHLLDYWGQMHRAEWPVALTQDGIADVVGISRSHVAVTLPALMEEEMAEASTQRVEGRTRRVKVYSLTYKGGTYAGQLVQRLLPSEVMAKDNTGEWALPLDGLIQVHRVHMLTALRLVDEDNRVDLRKATDMAAAPVKVDRAEDEKVEVEPAVEEVAQVDGVKVETVEVETPEMTDVAGEEDILEKMVAGGPVISAAGDTEAVVEAAAVLGLSSPGEADPVQGHPSGDTGIRSINYLRQPAYYWSPLRFGSGRRPTVAYVSSMLFMGFVFLMSAVALFGVAPVTCIVAWAPLVIMGVMFGWIGFKEIWALGERREVWSAAAMSAYMLIGVTMLTFAAFGWEAVVDLLWAGLILGIPSLVLAAGTRRRVERRGSFMLFIGPVMVIAALTMAVLDPAGMGRTGAMPILIVTVGVAWAFVGWMMVRETPDVEATHIAVAGGSIGLAISVIASAGNLAMEGSLSPVMGMAMAFWVAGAVYVAAISAIPSMTPMRPDNKTIYTSLAVAGAAALLTASVFFIWGGLLSVGVLETVIAVGMMALVAPEMKDLSTRGLVLMVLGVMIAAISVLAVSVGL